MLTAIRLFAASAALVGISAVGIVSATAATVKPKPAPAGLSWDHTAKPSGLSWNVAR